MPAATVPRVFRLGSFSSGTVSPPVSTIIAAQSMGLDPRLISLSVVGKRGEQLGCREKLVKIRDVTENDEGKNYKSEN